MYKQEFEKYNGDLNVIVNDIIRYAVESTSEIGSRDGRPIYVEFEAGISEDKDCPPECAYFKPVCRFKTDTSNLRSPDTTRSVIRQFSRKLSRTIKPGAIVSFSTLTWKGDAQ